MKNNPKPLYKNKLAWLLMLLAVYLLVGFYYLPKPISEQLKIQLAEQYSIQAEMDSVHFNPLTFSVQINHLQLQDSNKIQWFTGDAVTVNFDPLNLLWGQWKFSELSLEKPQIKLVTDSQGKVSIPAIQEINKPDPHIKPLNLIIKDIKLSDGQIDLQANNLKENFSLAIQNLQIKYNELSLTNKNTEFQINLDTANNEKLALNGTYNYLQSVINTDLEFKDWQANTFSQILPEELQLLLHAGTITATGHMNWQLAIKPSINFSEIQLENFESQLQESFQVSEFNTTLNTVYIDTNKQNIDIQSIESNQANWQLLGPIVNPQDTNPELKPKPIQENTWAINVNLININNWPIEFSDSKLNSTVLFNLDQFTANEFNTLGNPFTLNSLISVDKTGTIEINSKNQLMPLNLSSEVSVGKLNLSVFSPWIEDLTGLVVTDGLLDSEQQLSWQEDGYMSSGKLSLKQLKINNTTQQPIVDLGELFIDNTTINSIDKTVMIDNIRLDQANGNIIIDENNNINLQNLKPQSDVSPAPEKNDWTIEIGQVDIIDTSTSLIDQSLNQTVTTQMTELNGQITGLSSESLTQADVDITGKFNQFSPISIKGKINPLSADIYTEIQLKITDLDLLSYSPYAENHLAYPVEGGKLNLEVEYSLNQHELKGKNHIVFKQLKFGNKQDVADAVDLPIKLAVSLLTNSQGVMRIDLPVAGNINDPKFSYDGLIGKAFFKLITNIVASPFKILGALIPNPDPNLSDINFKAGDLELLPSEQNKLDQIAQILSQKPELNLKLNSQNAEAIEKTALKEKKLLEKAPFSTFSADQQQITDWLESQLTVEQVNTYSTIETGLDYQKIWSFLIRQQTLGVGELQALTELRTNKIKNYLVINHKIPAEKIYVEQAQKSIGQQSYVQIGVSR